MGLGGCSTQDIERCALSARAVALIYNWVELVRAIGQPEVKARGQDQSPQAAERGGQTHQPRQGSQNSAGVEHIRNAAPQLTGHHRWYALARYIADKILAFVPDTPTPVPVATG